MTVSHQCVIHVNIVSQTGQDDTYLGRGDYIMRETTPMRTFNGSI